MPQENTYEVKDRRMGDMVHPRTVGGKVLNLYKQVGETPRERLERLRAQKPECANEVLSYAGRLDPMAEGVLIALVGSANKMRDAYLDMSKEYTLDVLFGFSTDTYDLLGKVMESGDGTSIKRSAIEQGLNEFRGQFSQEYPPFSSKPVDGKSLFEWARGGLIGNIVLPRRQVNTYDIRLSEIYKVSDNELLSYLEETIAKVQGDFRQEEILRLWHRNLRKQNDRLFPCATIHISCSSGTYARSIAHGLGQGLGVPALALRILRTKVGDYSVEKSLK